MIKIRGQQAWRRDYYAMKFDLLTFLVEYKSSVVNRGAAHGHRPVANTLISITSRDVPNNAATSVGTNLVLTYPVESRRGSNMRTTSTFKASAEPPVF